MKKNFSAKNIRTLLKGILVVVALMVCLVQCRKSDSPWWISNTASHYSNDVVDKWMTLQLRLIRNATGIGNGAFARPVAYSGIAAYEATDPGLYSWQGKYNGLSALPSTNKGQAYFWPASVNAALASMNRSFFTTTNSVAANLSAIDSLEAALNSSFAGERADVLSRSVSFGKSIADAVFAWCQTDGYNENNALAYTAPVGAGLWVPTPPAFGKASGPFWGNDRTILSGSGENAQPGPPIAYSSEPGSPFYNMVNDLYMASKVLTDEHKAMALFWRDSPGPSTPGHWLSITQQLLKQTNSTLDKGTMAYALAGICLNETVVSVFKTKYVYNQIRPVSYIRTVIGDTAWLSFIATPGHPEYSAAHAVVSAGCAKVLTSIFGDVGQFTDHTNDYLGFAPRTFSSINAIGEDAGNSRFYGGIHYQPSIDKGLIQGRKIAENIEHILAMPSGPNKQ